MRGEGEDMVLRKGSLLGLIASVFILCLAGSSFAETIQYSYDDMLRLTRVEYGNGTVVEYVYDNVGNRLAKTTSLPGSPVNSQPYTPSSPSPSDASTDINTNSGLAWKGGDPDAGDVVFYDIYLGTSPEPPFVYSGDQLTEYLPRRLSSLTTYYWRVVSIDNYNAVTEGPLWTFTTGNSPPFQATDPRPSNGESIVASNAYLSWADSGDPDPDDTITFDIYFGTSATPPLIQGDYQDNTYVLGDLDIKTTYYWKVVAGDNHGATTEGPLWTFETLGHAPTILSNITYTADTTLTKGNGPYIVKGRLTVNQGITLTIEPGTLLKFENGASLAINGTLIAQGNAGNEIILTSSKDDRYGGDTNGDGNATSPSRGDWGHLLFRSGSSSSILDHVIMKFGGYGGSGSLYIDSASPTIRNSAISNSSSSGIYVYLGAPAISGCSITENSSYGIYLYSSSSSSAISGNTLSGNGNYDLYYYYGSSGGVFTGNTINNGIYILGSGTFAITSNTINYNNAYPIRVGADDVGELVSSNTLNNVDGGSYLEVNGGTISRDAAWSNTFLYRILGNLTVRGRDGGDGVTTLTLGVGVKLRFSGGKGLQVGGYSGDPGALVARGTSGNPIVFTSDQATPSPGDWNGIRFYDTTDDTSTILEYCVVEYGGYGGSGNLYIDSASPTIRNSTIRKSQYYGIYIYNGSPLIASTSILESGSQGVYVYFGSPTITGSTIAENGAHGVYVSYGEPIITDNTFTGNGNYDLYVGGPEATVTGNTFYNGIYVASGVLAAFTLNIIYYNSDYPLRFGANDISALFTDNTVHGSPEGISVEVNGGTISRDTTFPSMVTYCIRGTLVVEGKDGGDGVTTLTIEPGVMLRFRGGGGLQVGGYSGDPGALVAQGTVSEPVIFTSDQVTPSPGDWDGIYFYETTDEGTTVFEHCVVEYASYGLYIYSTSPTIKNSTITRSHYHGAYIWYCSPTIASTSILESGSQGVYIYSGSPTITGSAITENGAHGVYVSYGEPIITDNTFTGNGNYDLYFRGPEATVTGNTLYNGIYVASGVLSAFSSNSIYYNGDYSLRLGANDVGALFSDNTVYDLPAGASMEVNGGTISRDAAWSSVILYRILGNLSVRGTDGSDAITTLTLDPGLELRFSWGVGLQVGGYSGDPGALVAWGTASEPLVFTSDQVKPAPGDWEGIYFYNTTDEGMTVFEHCVVEYGRYGLYIYQASPTIEDSTITKSQYYGIYAYYASPVISGSSILENDSYGMYNSTPWTIIDAEDNWWGDASGPFDPSDDRGSGGLYNPDGIGDRVSDGVNYEPWITDPANMRAARVTSSFVI